MAKLTNAFGDEEIESILKSNNYLRKVDTDGLRNEKPLTETQINAIKDYAVKLGMPREQIRYSDNTNTIYVDDWDLLIIGTDVLPLPERTDNPNSNISWRGAISHEVIGHREAYKTCRAILTKEDKLNKMAGTIDLKIYRYKEILDEVQASIRAAKFDSNLDESEQQDLLDDALFRLKNNGINFEDIKEKLAINER